MSDPYWKMSCQGQTGTELEQFELEPPDLVIADIRMPGMDGLELCREIRKTSTVPIVMMSGDERTSDMERAFRSGADAFLPKPFDIGELKTQIETLIAQRRARLSSLDPDSESQS